MKDCVDLATPLAWFQHDLADQRTDGVGGFLPRLGVVERHSQPLHPASVGVRDIEMDRGNGLRGMDHARLDLGPLALQFRYARLHRRLIQPVLDRCHDPGHGLVDLRQRLRVGFRLHTELAVHCVDMLDISRDRIAHLVGRHEPFRDPRQCAPFDHIPLDGTAVGADRAAMMVAAGIAVARNGADLAAADTALQQARQEMDGPAQEVEAACGVARHRRGAMLRHRLLPVADGLPQIVAHDVQMRHFDPHPFRFGIGTRLDLAGARVLDVVLMVPDAHSDIELAGPQDEGCFPH